MIYHMYVFVVVFFLGGGGGGGEGAFHSPSPEINVATPESKCNLFRFKKYTGTPQFAKMSISPPSPILYSKKHPVYVA